jgi:hypothetical protein
MTDFVRCECEVLKQVIKFIYLMCNTKDFLKSRQKDITYWKANMFKYSQNRIF